MANVGRRSARRSLNCATCGQPIPHGLKFCRSCGTHANLLRWLELPLYGHRSSLHSPVPPALPESSLQRLERAERSPSFPSQETQDSERRTLSWSVVRQSLPSSSTLFETALRGERQVVFVTGEAGIGKTTLVDAFLAQIRDRADVRITSGQCVEQYGPGEAYMPLLEATTRLCRGPGRERRIEGLKRYAPSWLVQLPGLLDPEDRALLQQRVQGTSRERMLREMAEAAELFTTSRALVAGAGGLTLERCVDAGLGELHGAAARAGQTAHPRRPIARRTYWPAITPCAGWCKSCRRGGQCEELRLTPLAEEAIGEYLHGTIQGRRGSTARMPLQRLTPMLHRRTGGNPLFVVNTVDDLIRQGVLD